MILGVDKGSTYIKTDNNLCIRATIRRYKSSDIILNSDSIVLGYDDEKWIVGEKGNYSTDLMKSEHYNTRLFILLAIGLSSNDINITADIVTGLPIGLYSIQKKQMKDLLINTSNTIHINGKRKNININRVEIFPEGAGAFYSQQIYKDALIIDIGGLSVDIAQFRGGKLIKFSTYTMGAMKLYSKIAHSLNSAYALSLDEWDIENVLNEGLYIYGMPVDTDMNEIASEHVLEIIEKIALEYDIKSNKNVFLTGGPSDWLIQYFKFDIPQLKSLGNSQFTNAIGYANVGKVLFK